MLTTTDQYIHAQPLHDELTAVGPILVASDGSESAEPALRAASMLAGHTHASVTVLAVLDAVSLVAADYGMLMPAVDTTRERRSSLIRRVQAQLRTLGSPTDGWQVEIREGDPSATIARAASDIGARMIVVGLGRRDLLDRIFGGEVALHTLRYARVPVLAVPLDFRALPRRAVVATDFSFGSVSATRKAIALLDTVESVHLVHVAPPIEVQPEAFAAWMAVFGEGVAPAFDRVTAEMGLPDSVKVETETRTGKPSREVLEFAESTGADLIITGSRGAGLIDRMLVGSTATGILRGAQCAVLAVPTGVKDSRLAWPTSGGRQAFAAEDWTAELDAFTKRNIGRIAAIEVDDPEMGAQSQEHGYPFLGATWDHHDERVDLMLGDFEGVGRHLTRSIAGVTEIDLLKDEHDRDWILRIAHGRGQTILALKR